MKSLHIVNWVLATSLITWALALNNDNNTNTDPTNKFDNSAQTIKAETKKEVFQFIPKDWYIIPTDEETINQLITEATEAEEELDEITKSTWNKFYYGCKNFNWKEYYIFSPEMTIPTGFFWDLDKKDYKKLQKAPNCSSTNENQENQENPMT